MKLKKYGKGGKYEMYNKGGVSPKKSYSKGGDVDPPQKKPVYGPPKPPGYKEPTEKEKEESRGEAAYLKRRKEADRAYRQAIKEGATEAQAVKIAEKYLSQGGKMYLTGGQVKLDVNKDGEISGSDFKMLRAKKK